MPKETTGSLAVQDELNRIDYCEFLSISKNVKEIAGTDSESFSGVFLNPKRINTDLSKEILDLLIEYYCDTYNKDFVALSNIHVTNSEAIPVLSKVNIYRQLRLGSKVFRSSYSKRHI
ncbi:2926_t:CDS:1 [Funneliformis mosseae]|uniref:2926_t:CDS:1 n=1 Tax=Funneliformis mosseae TaxID=27381 RepID=A0A9N9G4B0_FUNMO|nr:2926_t:CDS:1 [Funneliformis mosseae]